MTLDYWLWLNRVPKAQLAKHLGVTPQSIILWVNGEATPNKTQMTKLYWATGGQVLPNDFFPMSDDDEFTIENGLFPISEAPQSKLSNVRV